MVSTGAVVTGAVWTLVGALLVHPTYADTRPEGAEKGKRMSGLAVLALLPLSLIVLILENGILAFK